MRQGAIQTGDRIAWPVCLGADGVVCDRSTTVPDAAIVAVVRILARGPSAAGIPAPRAKPFPVHRMLVWLASYPRSGNTFVRVILNSVFGVKTTSLYGQGDMRVFSAQPGVMEAVGHFQSEVQGAELIAAAQRSDRIYFVKTHEAPPTADPTIYIVRDGRSAIASYHHYLNEVEKLDVSREAVIEGKVYAGSWSDHFATWNPLERSQTLLLRYEEITRDTDGLIRQLAEFSGTAPRSAQPPSFEDLHALHPNFFRAGSDGANIAEMAPHLPRFLELHGPLMRRLGYLS